MKSHHAKHHTGHKSAGRKQGGIGHPLKHKTTATMKADMRGLEGESQAATPSAKSKREKRLAGKIIG
jgi:hypothetical protein